MNPFQPTEPQAHDVAFHGAMRPTPGFARTGTGREVFDTGKVLIGIRAGEQTPRPIPSRDAELLQDALIRHNRDSADEVMEGPPYFNNSATARIGRAIARLLGGGV